MAPAPHADGEPFWVWPDRADGGLCRAPGNVAADPMNRGWRAIAGEALSGLRASSSVVAADGRL